MKKMIRFLLLLLMLSTAVLASPLVLVERSDVMLINSLARFIDFPPEGNGLVRLEQSLENQNPVVRGLAAVILFKHYKKKYIRPLLKAFTLNEQLDEYDREGRTLVKIEYLNKILQPLEASLLRISDERVRPLLLFYHFRHKNLWLAGASGEKLSMAKFYRISVFADILDTEVHVTGLASLADQAVK